MKRHSVTQFGGGWKTPAVEAKEVRHGAKCLGRIPGPEPAERVQSAVAKVEVHDRSTSEIDHQGGCLAFESNDPAPIRHNLRTAAPLATAQHQVHTRTKASESGVACPDVR